MALGEVKTILFINTPQLAFNASDQKASHLWHSLPQSRPADIAAMLGIREPQLKKRLASEGAISEYEYMSRLFAGFEHDIGATVDQNRCYRCGLLIFTDEEIPTYLDRFTHTNHKGLCTECDAVTETKISWETLMMLKGWRRGLCNSWIHRSTTVYVSTSEQLRKTMTTPRITKRKEK